MPERILKDPVHQEDHCQGASDAAVTLVEYADFECPYCARAKETVERLQKAYGDRLCFVFRHYPLDDIHEMAKPAAVAAEAAGRQGKFWEMHDLLFDQQDVLSLEDFPQLAGRIGLDVPRFNKDCEGGQCETQVSEDMRTGDRSGVDSTPTFFVNGVRVEGSSDYKTLSQAIQ